MEVQDQKEQLPTTDLSSLSLEDLQQLSDEKEKEIASNDNKIKQSLIKKILEQQQKIAEQEAKLKEIEAQRDEI